MKMYFWQRKNLAEKDMEKKHKLVEDSKIVEEIENTPRLIRVTV